MIDGPFMGSRLKNDFRLPNMPFSPAEAPLKAIDSIHADSAAGADPDRLWGWKRT